ncbi:MAG TPA: hypothetical protein VHV55_11680 [Pirellulales bacterium]|jgi:hypothetical protein|nr:hypothetical protein [Pirellulales bacterium]
MRPHFAVLLSFLLSGFLPAAILPGHACRAQSPAKFSSASTTTGGPNLRELVDKRVDVKLNNGKTYGGVTVVKVMPGTAAGAIRSLTFKLANSPRQQTVAAQMVQEIIQSGVPLDVAYAKKTRELAYSAEKHEARLAHDAKVKEQLRAKRARFWEEISEADIQKYVDEEKAFAEKASKKINVPMQLIETQYYLFYTDMPLDTVGIYVQYLDSMYREMTKAFDFPEGKNIWRGKCPVMAFAQEKSFLKFEREVMEADVKGAQGLCHSYSNGRVVMSCFKGDTDTFFAVVLVHETSHGFIHRYKSTVHIPPWINEGVADWVAGTVVGKLDDEVQVRQMEAVGKIRISGSLGGDFFSDNARLDGWQYGVASSMVELLLRIDPKKYRLLIDNVKEGLSSEEALRDAFGFGFVELTQRYGQLARVPNLQP